MLASKYRSLIEEHFRTTLKVADYAKRLCVSSERLRQACVRSTASSPTRPAQCTTIVGGEALAALYRHERWVDRRSLRVSRPGVLLALLHTANRRVARWPIGPSSSGPTRERTSRSACVRCLFRIDLGQRFRRIACPLTVSALISRSSCLERVRRHTHSSTRPHPLRDAQSTSCPRSAAHTAPSPTTTPIASCAGVQPASHAIR